MTIAVAMSGGVDSSTVAAMLKAEGHNLVGLTMQLWNQRRLADKDGIPHGKPGQADRSRDAAARSTTSMMRGEWRSCCRFLITWSITKSASSGM